MEQRQLGRTGLRVSRLGLGTMTWSRDTDEHDAARAAAGLRRRRRHARRHRRPPTPTAAPRSSSARCSATSSPRDEVVLCTKAGRPAHRDGGRASTPRAAALLDIARRARCARLRHRPRRPLAGADPGPAHARSTRRCPRCGSPSTQRARPLRRAVEPRRLAGGPRGDACSSGDVGLAAVEVEYSLLQRGIEREVRARRGRRSASACSPGRRWAAACSPASTAAPIPADSRAASPHLAGLRRAVPRRGRRPPVVEAVATAADGPRARAARGRARLGAGPRPGRVGDRRGAHGRAAARLARGRRPRAARRDRRARSTRSARRRSGYPERR